MNEAKTSMAMPIMNAIASAPDNSNTAYGIVVAVGLGLFAVWKMAGKVSRDKVGFHEDRAREDVIKSLTEALAQERAEKEKAMDDAREAWDTRTADAAKIAELTVTVRFLNETVDKLRKDIHQMADKIAVYETQKIVDHAKELKGGTT